MTETSSLLTTYSIPNSYPVAALPTSVSPVPNGNLSPPIAPDEEEYTIKCVCGYNDDDGNTVYCEKCDTWQHIECYYHGQQVPEIHFCTGCLPKGSFLDINADKARDRQRRARELLEGGGDRKVKRPASKGQKKKHRDTVTNSEQPNGWANHDRQDILTNGRDQPPPAKKAKISHRASGSIASLNGESRKRAHSNVQSYPSPSKSPQELYRYPIIPQYTSEFLDLYKRDTGDIDAKENEHTISGSQASTIWKTDPSLIASHTENALNDRSPFIRAEGNWDESKWPDITVHTTHGKDLDGDGRRPTWKSVRLESDVRRNTVVGEIRGQVGTLEEYCHQLQGPNRWKDLSHPDPFVFFHPHMDIYIDSRRSGTKFRYIRRSCDPNVTLRSYITADDEIHHCFVANKDISAGTELTATWYLSGPLFVNEPSRDNKEQLFQERCDYISQILANFGDCACGLSKCLLEGFDRRSSLKPPEPTPKQTAVRKKRTKPKHAISPLSTGQANNSRANSETIKGQDEDDDQKSSSGSSHTGVRSRDLTPQGGALLDQNPVLDEGLTAREKRKIEALEKATKEQSQKVEKKQKKRASGGSTLNTPNVGLSKQMSYNPTLGMKRHSGTPPVSHAFKDVSNRPAPTKSIPKPVRPVYVSTGVQTDFEAYEEHAPPLKRRKFCTPTQRLLRKLMEQRASCLAAPAETNVETDPPNEQSDDVEMKDATTSVSTSPSTTKSVPSPVLESSLRTSAIGPLPSQAAHTYKVHSTFKTPAPKLNLSNLPPVPTFSSTSSITPGTPSSVSTPNVTTSAIAQSPGSLAPPSTGTIGTNSIAVGPSPAKKKISLGDYRSRKKEVATPSSEKHAFSLSGLNEDEKNRRSSDAKSEGDGSCPRTSQGLLSGKLIIENFKAAAANNEHAIEDTPMQDAIDTFAKQSQATLQTNDVAKADAGGHTTLPEVQDVLSTLSQMQQKRELGHA
ncbi:SET domain-containing protein 3 [Neophaeococcomyces mojaviensis]|uniref:SET domain-containing protein 3 n=1 Tax=Neophaeococcomyces mojaviensis TaxID=3383035 RepID=A0ACC2ZYC1_9EURO|nr:SET domain-containing protein 3 [Knufia sp. JES_112]